MKPFNALYIVLLAVFASASPVIMIPLTKLQHTGSYLKGAPSANYACITVLQAHQASELTTVPATNLGYFQYTTRVNVGSPPTYYNILVNIGFFITFIEYMWMFD